MSLHCISLCALLLAAPPVEVRSRTFQFTYAAVVTGLKPDQTARIWVPAAQSNDDQETGKRSAPAVPQPLPPARFRIRHVPPENNPRFDFLNAE